MRRRQWPTIRVRTLLIVVLAIGLPCGWWAGQAHRQRSAAARVRAIGGSVVYDHELLDESTGEISAEAIDRVNEAARKTSGLVLSAGNAPARPRGSIKRWAEQTLGVDFVHDVVHVYATGPDQVHDADLATFSVAFPNLQCLHPRRSPITDAGLAHLAKLRSLQSLYLGGTQVTDAGLIHLEGLDRLKILALPEEISDAGLARLSKLKSLKLLTFASRSVTDQGLKSLEDLTNLRTLFMIAPKVTPEGVDRLRRAIPGLVVR